MKKPIVKLLVMLSAALCLLSVPALAADDVAINEDNFPNANFRSYVSKNIDKNSDGKLSATEIASVKEISVSGQYIRSLQGIEYFENLKQLNCSNNYLTELDVSKNTALTKLDCSWNKLTSLDVSKNTALEDLNCWSNRLTSLDVSKNTALTSLDCADNQLTELDACKNTALTELDCCGNQLTVLDVGKNPALATLWCYSNQLTVLDVSGAAALEALDCYENQLTSLDVSKNPALTSLQCYSNQLTVLDVSGAAALEKLNCSKNQLTALDVSKNTALKWLTCDSNQLTALDVGKNTALTGLNCSGNQLTSLDVSKNTALVSLDCTNNAYTMTYGEENTFDLSTLPGFDVAKASNWVDGTVDGTVLKVNAVVVTYDYDCGDGYTFQFKLLKNVSAELNEDNFPDATFRSYVSKNFDKDKDGILSAEEINVVKKIGLDGYGSVQSLKGIEYFEMLTELTCWSQLTSLDVSKNTALTSLDCSSNKLTSLDLSKNTALTSLKCGGNQLAELDVSKNTALTSLDCSSNKLTSLDVSKNATLTSLYCDNNQLTSLDVSKNVALERLYCRANQLTSLDVSKNTALTSLDCMENRLLELDVSGATALEDLICWYNPLTTLDVSNNTALEFLNCENNQLTSLDVSKNAALEKLLCDNNQLTSLNVSGATALKILSCSYNQLTKLDIGENAALEELSCDNNQLTALDFRKNTTLEKLWCGNNQLTSLDVGNNTALRWLFCNKNQLTSLDVSKNAALREIDCSENAYAITLDEGNKFDLSTLPGFDVTKASNWTGGTVDGTVLTCDATSVTYDYDCGGGRATTFTLMVASVSKDHTTLAKVDAKAATCTENGNREYWHCSGCGKDFLDEAGTEEAAQADIVIPALGHSFTNYVYNNDAKVGVDGTETAVCDRDGCDATDTRTAEGTALPEPEKTEFKDVTTDAYYAPAVDWAVKNNVVYGTSDTTFSPDEKCTRAHVVAFLWRAKGRPEPSTTENPFTDVTANDYFYKAVLWAVENGIVYGTSDTTFEPNSPCTRAQVAAFLYRAEKKPEPTTDSNPFTDVKSGEYYEKAVIWAVENGIVYGTSDTTFEPDATCTRAQGVAFLYRAYGK